MAMTWTSLVAPKGSAGSIMNWVNYSKLDQETCVDEAQSLIFESLRVREMRTEWTFGMAIGQANQALPARFLDPIGRLFDLTNNTDYDHNIESDILKFRAYDSSLTGSFGANPFTTVAGSSLVEVNMPNNAFTQDSTITILGAAGVDVLTLNGAFPVVSIIDPNNFMIDAGTNAVGTVTGGGSAATYTGNQLLASSPTRWSVWDEQVKFDCAFWAAATLKLLYYRSPALLSATNNSNWLTNRYPMLMRTGCMAAAANYMKDDGEYQKQVSALGALIGSIASSNDMIYRGAEFGTDTP